MTGRGTSDAEPSSPEKTAELFTIGHSRHSLEKFLPSLQMHGIGAVADVRPQPRNSLLPHFNRWLLYAALRKAGIGYCFLGRELGAQPIDHYDFPGFQTGYELIAESAAFRAGIEHLKKLAHDGRVALLGVEADPLECHRAILIGRHLQTSLGFEIRHILGDGLLETHDSAEHRLMSEESVPEHDSFYCKEELLDRAYRARAERIGCHDDAFTGRRP
jgi:uncharacterized protein (DUF488 family)